MNWGRIFIAPSAFKSNTQFAILTHELVHLHTCQKIGIFRFEGNVPAWFSEGLAVLVSNGAGAEMYTDSAGIDWINEGKCFTPTKKGNLLKTSGKNNIFLPSPMFYKQSSLFIAYLQEGNKTAFHGLLMDMILKRGWIK